MWEGKNPIIILKEKHFKERTIPRKQPEIGLLVHIDFYPVLFNNDFQWVIQSIRRAILNELFDHPEFIKEKNRYILNFDIESVKTENSIEILLTIALTDPDIRDFLIRLGIQAVDYLIHLAFRGIKKRETSIKTRFNIKKIEGKQVEITPDGKIKYFDGVEETFTIEQTERRFF